MDFTAIDEYIKKLPSNETYINLLEDNKNKNVFAAYELLKDNFRESKITDRAVALQTLFMLEGEEEEFSKYKRHGVESFSTKGISISFNGSNIAPDVLEIMGANKATVGRLI